MSDFARFMAKVHINTQTGCWEWTACRSQEGYGVFKLAGRPQLAHRVAFEFFIGPLPGGDLQADHLCRVRHCVNPYHLEMVTTRANTLRGVGLTAENARKTHCPADHAYDEKNTRYVKGDMRRCRACEARQQRERRQRRRQRREVKA